MEGARAENDADPFKDGIRAAWPGKGASSPRREMQEKATRRTKTQVLV